MKPGMIVLFKSDYVCDHMIAGQWRCGLVNRRSVFVVERIASVTMILHDLSTPEGYDGTFVYLSLRDIGEALTVLGHFQRLEKSDAAAASPSV